MLTAEELRRRLRYDPATGQFTRAIAVKGYRAGGIAGRVHNGRRYVHLLGRSYLASRLAWLYVHGTWPTDQIDHIDGDKGNDRIANLRDVTDRINKQNRRTARRDNSCGLLGVTQERRTGRFVAQICVDGQGKYLGTFGTGPEAHAAYLEAKRRLHAGNTL